MTVIKHIVINGCIDGVCPFFKRTHHPDYNDELTCTHPARSKGFDERHMHDCNHNEYDPESARGEPPYKVVPADCGEVGLFPKFCPLDYIDR